MVVPRQGRAAAESSGEQGPQVHVIANQKGGVGKTTMTMNLAAVTYQSLVMPGPIFQAVAEESGDPQSPVLVLSTDPQASSVYWSRRMEKRGGGIPFDYDQVHDPAKLPRLRGLPYRHIFIDTPGSLEDEAILRRVLEEAHDVVLPMEPEALSYDPTRRTIEKVLQPLGLPYRVVVNKWDPRDGEADLKETAIFIKKMGWPMCNTVIRRYKVHARAAAEGLVVTQYTERAAERAANDFLSLALELGYGGATQPAADFPPLANGLDPVAMAGAYEAGV